MRRRPRGETSLFVVDAHTSECLHYEAVQGYPPKALSRIPREILKEHPDLEIRNDLIDCQIDICSVEARPFVSSQLLLSLTRLCCQVPSLFQDNFDYGDIRRDFVHGVLTSDLLMKSIHCHIISDGYAARAKDTKSYASITWVHVLQFIVSSTDFPFVHSKDILSRWTFPLVPDDNLPGPSNGYEHRRGNIYLARSDPPVLARTSTIGPLALLGPGTSVQADACVQRSVLGRRCTIGAGAVVRDSVLWDGVRIEAGSVVDGAVLGAGVRVLRGSVVEAGCLVADGVVIGPEARLKRCMRVSKGRKWQTEREANAEEDEDSELEEVEEGTSIFFGSTQSLLSKSICWMPSAQTDRLRACLGAESDGIVWPDAPVDEDEDDDDDDEINSRVNQRLLRLGQPASLSLFANPRLIFCVTQVTTRPTSSCPMQAP